MTSFTFSPITEILIIIAQAAGFVAFSTLIIFTVTIFLKMIGEEMKNWDEQDKE